MFHHVPCLPLAFVAVRGAYIDPGDDRGGQSSGTLSACLFRARKMKPGAMRDIA